jgi:phosphoribosylanthranilate isomerase
MIVKICGITQPQQAKEISQLGANYLGTIFYPKSPRYVDLDKIIEIKQSLNESTKLVVVVVNQDEKTVEELLYIADIIQFHGDEDYSFVKNFPKDRVIKVFRIKEESQIKQMEEYMKDDYCLLLDTYKEGMYGGTGETIDIQLLKKVLKLYDKIIVSGGLGLDNIKEVLSQIKPYGVDASSKLEIKPGIKDINKVKQFIEIVKSYESNN